MLSIIKKIETIATHIKMRYILTKMGFQNQKNYLLFVKLLQCFSLLGFTLFLIELIDILYEKTRNMGDIPIQKGNFEMQKEDIPIQKENFEMQKEDIIIQKENTSNNNIGSKLLEYIYNHKKEIAGSIVGLVILFGGFTYLGYHGEKPVDGSEVDVRNISGQKWALREIAAESSENFIKVHRAHLEGTLDERKTCAALSADTYILELEHNKNPVNYIEGIALMDRDIRDITDRFISLATDDQKFLQTMRSVRYK